MSSIQGPGGSTIYIRQNGPAVESSSDEITWNEVIWPCVVQNTNTSLGILKIEFTTDITLTAANQYFITGTTGYIQYGSKTLKNDGTRPIITINGVGNYPGFIKNGEASVGTTGGPNVYVLNLFVKSINGSTIINNGGWLGQTYFGKSAANNYVINCSSDGSTFSTESGGILGSYAGSNIGASLYIIGCSSTGNIVGGGILGSNAGGIRGYVLCEQCWSEGFIQTSGGGIFGNRAARSNGYAEARMCYSTGTIQSNAGGIFAHYAGGNQGQAIALKCYSRGNIGSGGGGIYSYQAGFSIPTILSSSASAINCYSSGTIATPGNGIYGSSPVNNTEVNCYAANSSWSSSAANMSLEGLPNPIVGTTWTATIIDQPYELTSMGYSPYSLTNIDILLELNRSFEQTIQPGQSSDAAVIAGAPFELLDIQGPGNYTGISLNPQTGVISTSSDTELGVYILTIRSSGSYNITEFVLTIENPISNPTIVSCCQKKMFIGSNVSYTIRNNFTEGNVLIGGVRRELLSPADVLKIKMAQSAKRD